MLPVEYQLQNKKLVKQWVEALRRGKYEQVKGRLRRKTDTGYGYCCLGVLCEIAKPLASEDLLESKLQDDGYVPSIINELLQQKRETPLFMVFKPISVLRPDNVIEPVTGLNDIHNKSFAEIADLLEQTHLKESQNISTNNQTTS